MTQQEYEQKKRECWEEFNDIVRFQTHPSDPMNAFFQAFDRAYSLGKQTETITQEDIEKAAVEFAERTMEDVYSEEWDSEYVQGLIETAWHDGINFALGKQEKDRKGKPLDTYLTDEDKENMRAEYKAMAEAYESPRNNGEKEYAKGYMEALEWLFGIRFLTNDNK